MGMRLFVIGHAISRLFHAPLEDAGRLVGWQFYLELEAVVFTGLKFTVHALPFSVG